MRTDEWVGFALPWWFSVEDEGETIGCILGEEIGQFVGFSCPALTLVSWWYGSKKCNMSWMALGEAYRFFYRT